MATSRTTAEAFADRLRPEERAALTVAFVEAFTTVAPLPELGVIWWSSDSSAQAVVGATAGFVDGFLEGADQWAADLKQLFRLVRVTRTVGLAEFFARPIFEPHPTGLLPQSRQALADLQAVKTFGAVARWLDTVGPSAALEALRELVPDASDVATMLGNATASWLSELGAKSADPFAVGEQIGKLLGRVVLELIRAGLEPNAWMAAEVLATPVHPAGGDR